MRGQGTLTVAASIAATLAGRYVVGRNAACREAVAHVDRRLSGLGEVDSLSILPVVERLTAGPGFAVNPESPTSSAPTT